MRKYTRTEKPAEVLTPQAHKVVEDELHRLGKTSARELDDQGRENLNKILHESDRV